VRSALVWFVRLLQDNGAEILDTVSCKNVLEVVVRVASIMGKSFEKVICHTFCTRPLIHKLMRKYFISV